MRKRCHLAIILVLSGWLLSPEIKAQGQLDPIRLNSLFVNGGIGVATHYFGNGTGFGTAIKGSVEKGLWDYGPGIVSLGGELTMSWFGHSYGNGGRESWFNSIIGGRGVYHYGWNVEALDTYGGVAAGIGFCGYSHDDLAGSSGYQPVFPYIGLFVGGSWFLNKQLGVNAELGFSSTYFNVGVVYKIK